MIATQRPAVNENRHASGTGFRRFALGCGFASMALVIVLALAGLWVVQRFKQLDQLEKQLSKDYVALETAHRFLPPAEGAARLPAERLESYRRVRAALLQTVPPELDRYTAQLLESGAIPTYEHAIVINRFFDFLRVASGVHLEALKAEQMSLREYSWIHGHRMARIFEGDHPERKAYEATLADLARVLESSSPPEEYTPADYVQELKDAYGKGGEVGNFDAPDERPPSALGRVLDLAFATPRVMTAIDEMEKRAPKQ